jgi:hypothetical protein
MNYEQLYNNTAKNFGSSNIPKIGYHIIVLALD